MLRNFRNLNSSYLHFSLFETPLGERVRVEIRRAAYPHEVAATGTAAGETFGQLGVKHLSMA